jgi:DNA repair ATPase RecN
MLEVEIRNFQSIKNVRLKASGFTAIVGRSNIGKSAIVRAIKCALTNPGGTSFVRHNPDSCARLVRDSKKCKCAASVRITTEGWDIFWEKGDSVNQYEVNGSTYDKADRGTPDFLKPVFDTIDVGNDKYLLQVSDQFKPIFLLDQSGGVVADVLSDVARLDSINVASRLAERDRKEAASTRKIRERDIELLQVQLQVYAGLDSATAKAKEVELGHAAVLELTDKVEEITRYSNQVTALVKSAKRLQEVLTKETPEVSPIELGEAELRKLTVLHERLISRAQEVGTLQGVDDLVLPDCSLEEDLRVVLASEQWLAKLRTFKAFMDQIKGLEGLADPDLGLVNQVHQDFETLSAWAVRLLSILKAVETLESGISSADGEAQTVQTAIDELGVCPTCMKPISSHAEHA